jgi:hypothetical protein
LLVEAAALMLAVHAGLRVLRFIALQRRLDRWAARGARSGGAASPHAGTQPGSEIAEIERVRWAVNAMGRRIPRTMCLCEALTGYGMLRRRGYDAALRIGVRHGTVIALDAHAWVECDGAVVLGVMPALAEYAVLA